jgi:hypothetical protein
MGDPPGDGDDVAAETTSDVPHDGLDAHDFVSDVDCFQDIDIVFVLDVSTSMSWVLERLATEITAVWEYADAMSSHPDYDPAFGLVVFVDDVLVTNSGGPYAAMGDLQAEFNSWRAFCSTEAQPGGSPCRNMDCPENSLDALATAAEEYDWRPGALHVAIHVTDDTFKEYPESLCSFITPTIPVEHTYAQTVDLLVAGEIRTGVFATHTGVCSRVSSDPGFFTDWYGQPSIPDATGARAWDLAEVQSGALSLTEAISGFVLEEWCTDFI